jgi:diguanylate cyclase (GGDEF)-like protein
MFFNDAGLSLLVNRIAILGFFLFFAFWFHFILILSKDKKLIQNKLILFVIYLPSVIAILEFILIYFNGLQDILMIETIFYLNSQWFLILIIVYAVIYIVLSIVAIIKYMYCQEQNKINMRKDLKIYILILILSTISSIFLRIFSFEISSIAAVGLFTIAFIFYIMLKYGALHPEDTQREVTIVTDKTRNTTYKYIAFIYVIGGIVSLLLHVFFYFEIGSTLPASILMILTGIILYLIVVFSKKESIKEMALISISFVSIPVITLAFLPYGSITMWSISFLFIIITMIFTKREMIFIFSVSILSTQFLVWILMPEVPQVVNFVDYFTRIVLLVIAIVVTMYFNNIYVNRLKENQAKNQINQFLVEASSLLASADNINISEKLDEMIMKIGILFSADISYIHKFDYKTMTTSSIASWHADGNWSSRRDFQDVPIDRYDWSYRQQKANKVILFNNIDDMPVEAKNFRDEIEKSGAKAILALPIINEEKGLYGLIGIQSNSESVNWTTEQVNIFKIISNILMDTFVRIEDQNEIKNMAYHDYLTGLPNKRMFDTILTKAIANVEKSGTPLGIVLLDIDSFKNINDAVGHNGGNQALIKISKKLIAAVRTVDTVARTGGDEFLVLVDSCDSEEAIVDKISEIMNAFAKPITVLGQEFYLTASAGVALYPDDGRDSSRLIANADTAMYKAKTKGKNQYFVCSPVLKDEVSYKVMITNSLKIALEKEEFYIHYQPRVKAPGGEIIGVEALIRWHHPTLGNISPAIFIPIAEQSGVINDIGKWVLHTACMQSRYWYEQGYKPITMAVNVSVKQLNKKLFSKEVAYVLSETQMDAKYLEIEITESAAMGDESNVMSQLKAIEKLGVSISIDDFGTEYASLSRLKTLPISKIKIDKSFIDGIEYSDNDKAIVKTIIDLAKNLELLIIAEGVENENQLMYLQETNCNIIQGYFYYRPMSPDKIEELIK